MFRLRRYRVFLVFALISIGLFYHFGNLRNFESAGAASVESLKHFAQKSESVAKPPQNPASGEPQNVADDAGVKASSLPAQFISPTTPNAGAAKQATLAVSESESTNVSPHDGGSRSKDGAKAILQDDASSKPEHKALATPLKEAASPKRSPVPEKASGEPAEPLTDGQGNQGRLEVIEDTDLPKIHWSQMPEHFPVPTESSIQLPTGEPKAIPRVQHDFPQGSKSSRLADKEKLDLIKDTFSFSWAGYRQKAWMQDELSPTSGKYRNPFCGWAATLVDSLDTLWLMDLKDEFDEAVEAVKKIDFTTSMRNDIPLFETVIRYLGGLIGAYDISGSNKKPLLDKAVELAEILMGAFDTPNRMPMTFYLWKPTFASQPHRAKTRVVLAELGSLSLEFTRLAQITKEAKYYDAIARITNEFELWQNQTKLPGLWPLKVDASGCKKIAPGSSTLQDTSVTEGKKEKVLAMPEKAAKDRDWVDDLQSKESTSSSDAESTSEHASAKGSGFAGSTTKSDNEVKPLQRDSSSSGTDHAPGRLSEETAEKRPIHKRETGILTSPEDEDRKPSIDEDTKPKCQPQGLASPPFAQTEEFSLGGLADSTYEYLPKEYLLLGGLEDKYRSMYEMAADASKQYLIYRPMIADEKRSILQAGLMKSSGKSVSIHSSSFRAEGTHLTCFAGGMFALGARVFDREEDLDIGKKLADGCVWAYQSTKLGIMPENFLSIPCQQKDACPWNETLWQEKLDVPYPQTEDSIPISHDGKNHNKEASDSSLTGERPGESKPGKGAESLEDGRNTVKDSTSTSLETSQSTRSDEKEQSKDKSKSQKTTVNEQSYVDDTEADSVAQYKHDQRNTKQTISEDEAKSSSPGKALEKRQLGEVDEKPLRSETESSKPGSASDETSTLKEAPATDATSSRGKDKSTEESESATGDEDPSVASKAQHGGNRGGSKTHEQLVKDKIAREGLPLGMTKIMDPRYILRPEAIESVFIMYRITGDDYWRKHGWEMFTAIEENTKSKYGASAIASVLREDPRQVDEMESFWLAETLKYFYLLFSDPSLLSLDDYVLNTEAHPFKRPTKS